MTRRAAPMAVLACLAVAAPVLAAGPALAAAGDIRSVTVQGGRISMVLSGQGLPAGKALTAADVQLTLDGSPVKADVRPVRVATRTATAQYVVSAAVPAALAGKQISVAVAARVGKATVTDDVALLVPGAAKPSRPAAGPRSVATEGWWSSGAAKALPIAAIFLGLLVLALGGVGAMEASRDDGSRTRRLLSQYSVRRRGSVPAEDEQASSGAVGDTAFVRTAFELAGRVASHRDLEARLKERLDRAAVPFKPAEWLLLQLGLGFGLLLLLALLGSDLLTAAVFGVIVGVVGPSLWLRVKAERRRRAFQDGLPEALQLVAGSLRTGYSLAQSLDALVQNGDGPLHVEMGRAIAEARLGLPVEDALESVAERMGSQDFRWTVMAIRVQREVGGNLAEVLTTTAATMRERARLRRQVQVLSAEGRLSSYILIALPIVMATYMFLFRRDYIAPLYSTGVGLVMLVSAVGLVVVGALAMRKLVQVEV